MNQTKIAYIFLLVALVAATATLSAADDKDKETAAKDDEIENEIPDDAHFGPDGGVEASDTIVDWFGHREFINEGLPDAVTWEKDECYPKSKKECAACCSKTNRAPFMVRTGKLGLSKACYCAKRQI